MEEKNEIVKLPEAPCYSDLAGQTVLVTGGGAGIGKSISLRLAAEKMKVVICGRSKEHLEETADLIHGSGGEVLAVPVDISRPEDITNLFNKIRAEFGALDVLVHNAAVLERRTFAETDAEFWRKTYATNLDSAFYLTKNCAGMMIPRCSGSLVFISTVGGLRAHQRGIAYDSSKAALDGFVRGLALEFSQHNIRVNAVAPGATMKINCDEIPLDRIRHQYIPLGRLGTSVEIAAAVAFLASRQSSYIIGQIIYVDGGITVQLSPQGIEI